MKKFRKAHFAKGLALGVAAMLSQNASAVNLSTDGIGEVAIAPYYTTRNGWQTLVNLTNTTQHPVVVKLRVHEAWNSRDVFDITIFMSSFDNFTSVITEGASGPVFRVVDTDTCTAPIFPASQEFPLSNFAYGGTTNPAAPRETDGGSTDIDRLREGYIEFIVEGHYTNNNDGNAANGTEPNDVINFAANEDGILVGGVPNNFDDSPGELIENHNCSALDIMFSSRANVLTAAQFAGEPINALKFNYRLINVARGVEAGGAATAWANFFNPGFNNVDGEVLSGDGPLDTYGIADDPNNADSFATYGGATTTCTITRGQERGNAGANTPGVAADEWDPTPGNAAGNPSCQNLITAQTTFDFLEPTLNDAYPAVAHGQIDRYGNNFARIYGDSIGVGQVAAMFNEGRVGSQSAFPQGDNFGTANGSIRGIDAVSLTIQRSAVINEWAENTGVAIDWIVNFPTKTFYVDQDPAFDRNFPVGLLGVGRQAGLLLGDRDEAFYTVATPGAALDLTEADVVDVPYPPFARPFITLGISPVLPFPIIVLPNAGGAPVQVEANLYDRAENTIAAATPGGSIPSPAPPVPITVDSLNFETNVITFNGNTSVLGSSVSTSIDTLPLTDNGWMHLRFNDASAIATAASGTIQAGTATGLIGWSGIPTTGFVVKQRTVGSASANYASSMDHGYRRECAGGGASGMATLALDPTAAFTAGPNTTGCPFDVGNSAASILTLDP